MKPLVPGEQETDESKRYRGGEKPADFYASVAPPFAVLHLANKVCVQPAKRQLREQCVQICWVTVTRFVYGYSRRALAERTKLATSLPVVLLHWSCVRTRFASARCIEYLYTDLFDTLWNIRRILFPQFVHMYVHHRDCSPISERSTTSEVSIEFLIPHRGTHTQPSEFNPSVKTSNHRPTHSQAPRVSTYVHSFPISRPTFILPRSSTLDCRTFAINYKTSRAKSITSNHPTGPYQRSVPRGSTWRVDAIVVSVGTPDLWFDGVGSRKEAIVVNLGKIRGLRAGIGVVDSLVTSLTSPTQCVLSSLPRVRSLATLCDPLLRPRYAAALPLEEN